MRWLTDLSLPILYLPAMKIYSYSGCDTCRKALKWLSENGLSAEVLPIRETPPSMEELRTALAATGSIRKLFNTSGGDYKELGMKDRLPTLSDEEALELLATRGNLIKRPFVLHGKGALVGFDAQAWSAVLKG